jgi:hypothetical protein
MKFKVQMKDPDTLHDAIEDAVTEELKSIAGLDDDDRNALSETRREKVTELCNKWFEYGEYLTVEIDTEASTCTVVNQ